MKTRFVLLLVLLLLFGGASACAQNFFVDPHSLTPQRCRIDQVLWTSQFARDSDAQLLSIQQLAYRFDESVSCMSIDPAHKNAYFQLAAEANFTVMPRILKFLAEHPIERDMILAADAKGENR